MNTRWTCAELEIVETLARRVCLMSASQVADIPWTGIESVEQIESCVNRLMAAKLLHRTVVNVHPRIALDKPLIAWKPSARQPDLKRTRSVIERRFPRPLIR